MTDPKQKTFEAEDQAEIDALEEGLEARRLTSRLDPDRAARLMGSARATSSPPKERITTRLPARDLARLKAKAMELGIPYQTLLASVVHRYVEGTLVDRDAEAQGGGGPKTPT